MIFNRLQKQSLIVSHFHSVTEGGGGGHGGHPYLPQRDWAPFGRARGLRCRTFSILLHRYVLAQEGFEAELRQLDTVDK